MSSCKEHRMHLLPNEFEGSEKCIIELTIEEKLESSPNRRVPLEISCPNSVNKCITKVCKWNCKHCGEVVYYGRDDGFLYCSCGKANAFESKFRCNDVKHGPIFIKFERNAMIAALSSFKGLKEINIVILGETGVGKSTWINAIANYFAFQNFEEAITADEIEVHIPSQFSYATDEGDIKNIFVGSESENEVLKIGHSTTQMPKAYRLKFGSHLITLLDTPGNGDVRGLEQDEKNFESILAFLSCYDEIHGICILLKPNESRLTATFRLNVTELLTHFHISAAQNIVFCFTNARSTFYRPGDTLPTLKKLLKELDVANLSVTSYNQFCFDNEAFRYLACLRNGVRFSKQDAEIYSSSWNRAVIETNRLFNYIQELVPHSLENTVSLNNARRIILELSRPLAETVATIQRNIDSEIAKSEELEASKNRSKELQDQIDLAGDKITTVRLDHTRTVCTNSSCVEYFKDSQGSQIPIYKKICDERCWVPFVPLETINAILLLFCSAISWLAGFTCRICSHSWRDHKHIRYEFRRTSVGAPDENTHLLLNKNKKITTDLRDEIAKLKTYIKDLKEEQTEIIKICAQFSCYLKKHAIAHFHDAIDSHLNMLLRQERARPSPNQIALEKLKEIKESYQQQKNIIFRAMEQKGGNSVAFISEPREVEILKRKLFGLRHNGTYLRQVCEESRGAKSDGFMKKLMESVRMVPHHLYNVCRGLGEKVYSPFFN